MRDFIFKPGDYVLSDVTIAGTTGRQEIITDQIILLKMERLGKLTFQECIGMWIS